jgi:hypothetical protein
MTPNVGTIDRILRVALGFGLIYLGFFSDLAFFDSAAATYAAIAVGMVMLIVAASRVCPVYSVLGIRTCRI